MPEPSDLRRYECDHIEWLSEHAFLIRWEDGHESRYTLDFLKLNCPCAACQGHGAQEFRVLGPERSAAPEESAPPAEVWPIGHYAMGIRFSDGHDTGIFSYRFLRRFCPCAPCRAEAGRPA